VGIRPLWIRTDRTRRGWHLIARIGMSLAPSEIVALQAILGSDDRRETLNLMRAIGLRLHRLPRYWRNRYNLLFDRKL
jgi:hypothetical protein